SGFRRQDAGYIDNPVYHLSGVNDLQSGGARMSALWKISDNSSLKLSALYQRDKSPGLDEVDIQPGLVGLQQKCLPGSGGFNNTVQAYSALLKTKIGRIDLTSLTGFNVNSSVSTLDWDSSSVTTSRRRTASAARCTVMTIGSPSSSRKCVCRCRSANDSNG